MSKQYIKAVEENLITTGAALRIEEEIVKLDIGMDELRKILKELTGVMGRLNDIYEEMPALSLPIILWDKKAELSLELKQMVESVEKLLKNEGLHVELDQLTREQIITLVESAPRFDPLTQLARMYDESLLNRGEYMDFIHNLRKRNKRIEKKIMDT